MKIGITGYQGVGKSTLFEWLTGEVADPAMGHKSQSAMATVPDPRIAPLCEVFQPKKVTQAALEVVDTPGLSRTHEGSAQKLALIREAGCLLVVVSDLDGGQPLADLRNFEDDLLIADLEILSGRLARLRDQVRKPRPNREENQAELTALEPLHADLEAGRSLRDVDLTPVQQRAIRSFQLFSEKPRLVMINVADEGVNPQQYLEDGTDEIPRFAISLGLQLELARLPTADREEFCREMDVEQLSTDALLRQLTHTSGQMLFFTAGDKEVRTWMLRRGGTALEAADGIHTDLANGFIRAETMNADDLIRLGSEREVKAARLVRQEPRDYVIQDGDVITVRHN